MILTVINLDQSKEEIQIDNWKVIPESVVIGGKQLFIRIAVADNQVVYKETEFRTSFNSWRDVNKHYGN